MKILPGKENVNHYPLIWFHIPTGMDDEEDSASSLDAMLDDKLRVSYYKGYLAAVHQAIKYVSYISHHSLFDNFW